MITPRPYLSYSQMVLFERSPKEYAEQYIYGEKPPETMNMAYGSQFANGLEKDEFSGDPVLDMMMVKIPKFELMDRPLEVELKSKDGVVPLLAKPDTAKADYSAFKEYKTSVRKWTQKMADDSSQITFYATAMWLKTKKIPSDIELINVRVEYTPEGGLCPTGEIHIFKTKRTMVDIIKMTARMKRVWQGINELCEKELL